MFLLGWPKVLRHWGCYKEGHIWSVPTCLWERDRQERLRYQLRIEPHGFQLVSGHNQQIRATFSYCVLRAV